MQKIIQIIFNFNRKNQRPKRKCCLFNLTLLVFILLVTLISIFEILSGLTELIFGIDKSSLFITPKEHVNKLNRINFDFTDLNPKYSLCFGVGNYNDGDNAELAKQNKIVLVGFVAIAPHFFEKRSIIRSTWGNKTMNNNFRLFFLVGLSSDPEVNRKLGEEYETYKDLVQTEFVDSYYNLTMKIMMGFKWVKKYCHNSVYVLRINDDVVVNTVSLMSYLEESVRKLASNPNENEAFRNTMMCYYLSPYKVIRKMSSKFYVSYEQYKEAYYDSYCEGSAYIMTVDLCEKYFDLYIETYWPPFSEW